MRETWTYGRNSSQGPQRCLRTWTVSTERGAERLFSLEKRRLRREGSVAILLSMCTNA